MRDPVFEDFSDKIGESFEVELDGASLSLVLEEAEALPRSIRESGFRLQFRGPYEPILPQAIYGLSNGGEADEIFIVPIGRDDAGTKYEAIFF